jgi:hypothetical protein
MRPPICDICDKDFDFSADDCGLIYFQKRQSDIDWDKKMKETGMVGHPPYARWFCPEHYIKAKELGNLTVDKAMVKLREIFE